MRLLGFQEGPSGGPFLDEPLRNRNAGIKVPLLLRYLDATGFECVISEK